MSESREPDAFARLRAFVASDRPRTETTVTEIPSPSRIAPWSLALAADVSGAAHGVDSDLGTGRFIALYDPEEPEGWDGAFRIVTFAQAPLEPEIGVDEFVADVTWSWLVDALAAHGATYDHASGTATRSSRAGTVTSRRRATARSSSCVRRGRRATRTSPRTSGPGRTSSRCSRACRPPRTA